MTLEIPTRFVVGAAGGLVLLVYFVLFDRFSILALAAVLACGTLVACTYFILGRPGKDWQLPIDFYAVAAALEAACRAAFGHARAGLAWLVARAKTAARGAWPALAALAAPRPPPAPPAVAPSGDGREAGAGAACSSDDHQ